MYPIGNKLSQQHVVIPFLHSCMHVCHRQQAFMVISFVHSCVHVCRRQQTVDAVCGYTLHSFMLACLSRQLTVTAVCGDILCHSHRHVSHRQKTVMAVGSYTLHSFMRACLPQATNCCGSAQWYPYFVHACLSQVTNCHGSVRCCAASCVARRWSGSCCCRCCRTQGSGTWWRRQRGPWSRRSVGSVWPNWLRSTRTLTCPRQVSAFFPLQFYLSCACCSFKNELQAEYSITSVS